MSFDPQTIATGLSLLSAGSQVFSGLSGKSKGNDLADDAREAAAVEAELELRKGRELAGRQIGGFAGRGIVVDSGTSLDVLAQTAADAKINALRAAFAFEQQAEEFESAGQSSGLKGVLGGTETILGSEGGLDFLKLFGSGGGGGSGSILPAGTSGGFPSTFSTSGIA